MRPTNIAELVLQTIPPDVSAEEFTSLGKPDWWLNKPRLAVAYALRHCERLNWDAYLENYPDVRAAGIDPVLHFLRDGIFENRRLFSWHPLRRSMASDAPSVSVVLYVDAPGVLLDRALESLADQTLLRYGGNFAGGFAGKAATVDREFHSQSTVSDMEIIAVDNASEDDSLKKLEKFATLSSKIRIISLKVKAERLQAIKIGVLAASGKYVMFLDGKDFYSPNTCATALGIVSKGYDIGEFRVAPVNHAGASPKRLNAFLAQYGSLPAGDYSGYDLMRKAFADRALSWRLENKIFERSVIQSAFQRLTNYDDIPNSGIYEAFVIFSLARNLREIEDRIYNIAVTSSVINEFECPQVEVFTQKIHGIIKALEEYADSNAYHAYCKLAKEAIFRDTIKLLPSLTSETSPQFFRNLLVAFGPLYTTILLLKNHFTDWEQVSSKFVFYAERQVKLKRRKIGICYLKIAPGGVETTILNMIRLLRERGIEVVLFLQQRTPYEKLVAPYVDIYYITDSLHNIPTDEQHVRDLYQAVKLSGVDTVLYMNILNPVTLWDTILLKLMDVSVIGSVRLDFNHELLIRGRKYPHSAMLTTLRCQDKVFCLSTSTEIYLRAQNIDAEYIPNTIRKTDRPLPSSKVGNTVVVIARMHERLKQVRHALRVFQEVHKVCPDAKLIFVGGWDTPDTKEIFYQTLASTGLSSNVHVTGWTTDPFPYIDQAKLLLSTSYLEGFPNGISEAQSRGLPVVMYYLDIMMAKDNESIIQVPQGDIKAAAYEIVKLLGNDSLRSRLSLIARKHAAKFSEERFASNLLGLIDNFDKLSSVKYYTPREYLTAINGMAFYAGKSIPAY